MIERIFKLATLRDHFINHFTLFFSIFNLGYLATAEYTSPIDEMQIFEEDDYY